MIAIILAAGVGTRMRPLTDHTHKTLLEIDHQPIIARIVDGLRHNGINRIVVVTGYLANKLQTYLVSRYEGLTFVHNDRYAETNNVVSLSLVLNSIVIDEDVLLIESDLIYEPAVIKQLIDSPWPNVALVDLYRHGFDGTVVTQEKNVITSIIPPHLQGAGFDFRGTFKTLNMYRFSQAFCATALRNLLDYYVKVVDEKSYYELILGILIYVGKETIYAEVVEGRWSEVDDPNDLSEAEFTFNPGRRLDILDNACGALWNYDVIDFCYIRNTYFPPSAMVSGLRNQLPGLLFSYGSRQAILNEKLSWFLLCDASRLLLLNGMAQVYPALRQFVDGRKVLMPSPTFGEYPRMFPSATSYADHVGYTVQVVEERLGDNEVVIFVNPNNPTGSLVPSQDIHDFAARYPDRLVVVDESFIDFSDQPSMLRLLEQAPLANVVVLKSLSKVLGVPGIRLGFLYTHHQGFFDHVERALPIWNSNSIAEFFLTLLLKFRLELNASLLQTAQDRANFITELRALALVDQVWPSGGNFLLVRLQQGVNADSLCRSLLATDGLYLKNVSDKMEGGDYLRLAVRGAADRQKLVRALQQIAVTPPL